MLILLTLSIAGSSAWLIVHRTQKDVSPAVSADTNPCFTSEVYYNGNTQIPALNSLGKSIYGFTSNKDYTVSYVKGYYRDGTEMSMDSDEDMDNMCKAAGTYYFKITDNTTGQIIAEMHELIIKPDYFTVSATKVSSPIFVGGKVSYTLTLSAAHNSSKTTNVTGLTYSGSTIDDYVPSGNMVSMASASCSIDISGKISLSGIDANNYVANGTVNYTLEYPILPTTYTSTSSSKTYYGSLMQAFAAIQKTTGALTVVPMQQVTCTYNSTDKTYYAKNLQSQTFDFKHEITESITIPANVTLTIPFNSSAETNADGTNEYKPTCKNLVTVGSYDNSGKLVGDGIIITNKGTINIGGVVGVKNANYPAGVTSGEYAALAMGCGSVINNNSKINAYGYLIDPTNSATVNCESGSVVTMPYVVYDYGGGTHTAGAYNYLNSTHYSPFNVYDMPNIHATTVYKHGAQITGLASMYANDVLNETHAVILSTSNALLNLASGKITIKHTPNQGEAFGTTAENSKPSLESSNVITFEGNMSTGSLSLVVSVPIIGSVSVSMSDVMCPISHKFVLNFNGNYEYAINSDYKLMPGCDVSIGKGATVNINGNLLVYSDAIYTAQYNGTDVVGASGASSMWRENTPKRPAAKLTVDGKLKVNKGIAGEIISNSVGATLDLSSATALSLSTKEVNGTGLTSRDEIYTESSSAHGIMVSLNSSSLTSQAGSMQQKLYASVRSTSGDIGWLDGSTQFNINYEYVGLNGQTVTNNNKTAYMPKDGIITLSAPNASGLEFAGWFTDSACSPNNQIIVTDGSQLIAQSGGDATIYGKFVENSTTIKFNTSIDAGNTAISISDMFVETGTSFNPYTNVYIQGLFADCHRYNLAYSRYFDGWYTSSDFNQNSRIDEEEGIAVSSEFGDMLTLYAKWGVKYKVSFSIPSGKDINYTIADVWVAPGDKFDPYSYDNNHAIYDSNVKFRYYFDAWYLDSSYTNAVTGSFDMPSSNIVLHAQWLSKLTISITSNKYRPLLTQQYVVGSIYINGSTSISVGGSFFLIPEQSCMITFIANDPALGSAATITNITASAGGFLESTRSGKEVTLTYTAPSSNNVTISVTGQKA
jgi:hypothetical protein